MLSKLKEIPDGFPCLDTLHDPNTRDVARLEKSVKKHEPLGDKCLDQSIQTQKKNIRYSFYKITTVVIFLKKRYMAGNFRVWILWSKHGYWPVRARVVYLLFYNQLSFPFVIAFKFSCILSRFSNIRSDMSMIVYVYIIHLFLLLTRVSHELAK